VDGVPPASSASDARSAAPPDPPAYVYAATDIRPRQPREIELCARAADFDWLYTGVSLLGVVGGVYANTQHLKHSDIGAVRMIGPGSIGLFWGLFLSGGYLSLPKCDPLWAYGHPPEGAVRSDWPIAIAITMIATASAPALDYAFLGPVKLDWEVSERSARVFVAMGAGMIGSIVPYLLPPRTWAAKKEIERIRLGEVAGGPFVSYGFAF